MFYGVLRTWLIAKEIIQRSTKAMKENTDPLWTAMIRYCFTSLFRGSEGSPQIATDGWVGQRRHQTSAQGLEKESQQKLGSEYNLLPGKREARTFRFQALIHSERKAAGLENPGSGIVDIEAN